MTVEEFLQQEAERVIQRVCSEHRVGKKDLLSKSTSPHFVRARRAAIRLLINESGFNKRQTADAMGMNITTIYYWTRPVAREASRKNMREYYHAVRKPRTSERGSCIA